MKNVYKRSTKILVAIIAMAGSFATWAMDAQNMVAIQQLLHGHQRALSALASLVAVYSVLHEPKKNVSTKK